VSGGTGLVPGGRLSIAGSTSGTAFAILGSTSGGFNTPAFASPFGLASGGGGTGFGFGLSGGAGTFCGTGCWASAARGIIGNWKVIIAANPAIASPPRMNNVVIVQPASNLRML
jgi:hypothetical protein